MAEMSEASRVWESKDSVIRIDHEAGELHYLRSWNSLVTGSDILLRVRGNVSLQVVLRRGNSEVLRLTLSIEITPLKWRNVAGGVKVVSLGR